MYVVCGSELQFLSYYFIKMFLLNILLKDLNSQSYLEKFINGYTY